MYYIRFPSTLKSVGYKAFHETRLYNEWKGLSWNNENWEDFYIDDTFVCHRQTASKNVIVKEGTRFIAGGAFEDCADTLESVSLPDSLESIGYSSFRSCNKLNEIILNSGLKRIDNYAFYSCKGLSSIIIPETVEWLGYEAFGYCASLSDVEVNNSLCEINSQAFIETQYYKDENNWDNDLLYVGSCLVKAKSTLIGSRTIRNNTSRIAGSAFYNCVGLTGIILPNSVEYIDDYAFSDCSGLKEITLSTSLKSIGNYAFENCTALKSIAIPDSTTRLGERAFYFCSALSNASFGSGLCEIERYTFLNCSALTRVSIPGNVKSIGDASFAGCSSLSSVTLSEGLETIEEFAFDSCPISLITAV